MEDAYFPSSGDKLKQEETPENSVLLCFVMLISFMI